MRSAARPSIVESLENRRLLAQIGVDHTFGDEGTVPVGGNLLVHKLSDGKLLTVAEYADDGNHPFNVNLLDPDGTLDSSFGPGKALKQFTGFDVATVVGQRVLVFYGDPMKSISVIAFDFDGKLDPTFGDGGVANIPVPAPTRAGSKLDFIFARSIAGTPDGGAALSVNYDNIDSKDVIDNDTAIIKITSNGALDKSFGDNGAHVLSTILSNDNGAIVVPKMTVDSQGNIITFAGVGTPNDPQIVRLKPDGTPDTSFGDGGTVDLESLESSVPTDDLAIAVQPDGKVLVAGTIVKPSEGSPLQILRLNTNGTLDKTFGDSGFANFPQFNFVERINLDSQGRIVFNDFDSVIRLTPTGQLDTTFDGDGIFPEPFLLGGGEVWLDSDDQMYLTNVFNVTRLADTTPITLSQDGTLFVTGSDADDQIGITNKSGTIFCTVNDQTEKFDASAVKQIFIDAGNGNNQMSSSLDVPTTVSGGTGNDMIATGGGIDRIMCGPGNDTVDAGGGNDYVHCSTGNYTIHGGDGNDKLAASGSTSAVIFGDDGKDAITAGDGNDSLYGGANSDTISAGAGNDLLSGGGGRDHLFGQQGSDRIYGGNGDDAVNAGPGNDRIFGQAGDDVIEAGVGNDQLDGGAGQDYLAAGPGDDTITANDGERDSVYGGDGTDTVTTDPSLDVLRSIEM